MGDNMNPDRFRIGEVGARYEFFASFAIAREPRARVCVGDPRAFQADWGR